MPTVLAFLDDIETTRGKFTSDPQRTPRRDQVLRPLRRVPSPRLRPAGSLLARHPLEEDRRGTRGLPHPRRDASGPRRSRPSSSRRGTRPRHAARGVRGRTPGLGACRPSPRRDRAPDASSHPCARQGPPGARAAALENDGLGPARVAHDPGRRVMPRTVPQRVRRPTLPRRVRVRTLEARRLRHRQDAVTPEEARFAPRDPAHLRDAHARGHPRHPGRSLSGSAMPACKRPRPTCAPIHRRCSRRSTRSCRPPSGAGASAPPTSCSRRCEGGPAHDYAERVGSFFSAAQRTGRPAPDNDGLGTIAHLESSSSRCRCAPSVGS